MADNELDTPAEIATRGCFGSLVSLLLVVALLGIAALLISNTITI